MAIFFDFNSNRDGLDNSSVDDADLLVGGERSLSHRYENKMCVSRRKYFRESDVPNVASFGRLFSSAVCC